MTDVERVKTSVEEYLRLVNEEHDGIIELINGELIIYAGDDVPKHLHQILLGSIYVILRTLLGRDRVLFSPVNVYIESETYIEPDIFWAGTNDTVCHLNTDTGFWYGAPALIVEIISPSSIKRDRIEKFNLYEKTGVREYWIVDPEGLVMEVYALENGQYRRHGAYAPGMSFTSPLLNHLFDVTVLFNS